MIRQSGILLYDRLIPGGGASIVIDTFADLDNSGDKFGNADGHRIPGIAQPTAGGFPPPGAPYIKPFIFWMQIGLFATPASNSGLIFLGAGNLVNNADGTNFLAFSIPIVNGSPAAPDSLNLRIAIGLTHTLTG